MHRNTIDFCVIWCHNTEKLTYSCNYLCRCLRIFFADNCFEQIVASALLCVSVACWLITVKCGVSCRLLKCIEQNDKVLCCSTFLSPFVLRENVRFHQRQALNLCCSCSPLCVGTREVIVWVLSFKLILHSWVALLIVKCSFFLCPCGGDADAHHSLTWWNFPVNHVTRKKGLDFSGRFLAYKLKYLPELSENSCFLLTEWILVTNFRQFVHFIEIDRLIKIRSLIISLYCLFNVTRTHSEIPFFQCKYWCFVFFCLLISLK